MYRPLRTKGIEYLEKLFSESAGDALIMRQLADELACRSTVRASLLLAAVQLAQESHGESASAPPASSTRQQTTQLPLLITHPPEPKPPATAPALPNERTRTAGASGASNPSATPDKDAPTRTVKEVSSAVLTPEAAYRLLKVSSSASWSAIESARRQIVDRASPEALEGEAGTSRASRVARAKDANEASALLWRERYPMVA